MLGVSNDADRQRLEREILHEDYQGLLDQLRKRHVFLRGFETWGEVVAFMRRGTSRDPAKDVVLLPIFQNHAANQDPRWRTILLVIFWPALESIHRQKRHWDSDADELWANVVWTFLRTVCRLDPRQRFEHLVQKVFNDTVHHLHDEYCRVWVHAQRQIATDPDELATMHGVSDQPDFAADLRTEQEARIEHFRTHRDAGRISGADFLLLVGTRVYGQSIADYARNAGLNYETAKKRHQRAMKAIGGSPGHEP
jgi:hypothetical protein